MPGVAGRASHGFRLLEMIVIAGDPFESGRGAITVKNRVLIGRGFYPDCFCGVLFPGDALERTTSRLPTKGRGK